MKPFIHASTGLVIELQPAGDGWFVAHVPDLPGCVSQGESIEDALSNIVDAIGGVLEVIREDNPDLQGLSNSTVVEWIQASTETSGHPVRWTTTAA